MSADKIGRYDVKLEHAGNASGTFIMSNIDEFRLSGAERCCALP